MSDNTKKTLYVVTSDCYSGYGVDAIFDDKDLAEKYCEGSDDSQGYGRRVEEYELNPWAEDIRAGRKIHRVQLDRDGNVYQHSESWGGEATDGAVEMAFGWTRGASNMRKIYRFEAAIAAQSKEQAIKAANERRARWIAEGKEWPADE